MQDALQNVRDNKEEISYLFLFYFPLILKRYPRECNVSVVCKMVRKKFLKELRVGKYCGIIEGWEKCW